MVPEVLSPPVGDWNFFFIFPDPYSDPGSLGFSPRRVQRNREGQTVRESGRKTHNKAREYSVRMLGGGYSRLIIYGIRYSMDNNSKVLKLITKGFFNLKQNLGK